MVPLGTRFLRQQKRVPKLNIFFPPESSRPDLSKSALFGISNVNLPVPGKADR